MKNISFKLVVVVMLITSVVNSQTKSFDSLRKAFISGYTNLEVPGLQINYVYVLRSIQPKEKLKQQEQFFKGMENKFSEVNLQSLTKHEQVQFYIMSYETSLNLKRIKLEKEWSFNQSLDESKSIYSVDNGKKWYEYILQRWVDLEVTPEQMFQFGLEQINVVKSNMKKLQKKSGLTASDFETYLNNTSFFIKNEDDVQKAFVKTKAIVALTSNAMFPYVDSIPEVRIEKGTNSSLSHVPAYYSNNTFYYNMFDEPFNKRQIGWFYAHEAIPGHHYQFSINAFVNRSEIQNLFWYPGFAEGWGAYTEHLGKELGVYKTIYDEYGKWEWDLIRSVRVALDVGINYYGWSDEKAISFWKEHIFNQDDIGWREIARMKRWPAQVITYKYGSDIFLKLLKKEKSKKGFDYKKFHKTVLLYGDIPISLLKRNLNND
jgi:uncharacterized protein (DUF885 family)